jgi:hypothetical protein
MRTTVGILLMLAGCTCRPVVAASTYVMEYMTITASSVATDSETEMDYNTEQNYCAIADGYLIVNGSITKQGSATAGFSDDDGVEICSPDGQSTASLSMLAAVVPNASYEMQTNHFVFAAYFYGYCDPYPTNCDVYYYDDPYGYSTLTAKNFLGLGTVNAPGTAEDADSASYYIASTYLYGTSSTHVSVVFDNVGKPAVCGTKPGVITRQSGLQLVTGSGVPITTDIPVGETITNQTTNTCQGGGQVTPDPCAATSSGYFQDFSAVLGNPANPSSFCVTTTPAVCGLSLTSVWSACGSGLTNNIWTSQRSIMSNGITYSGNSTGFPPGTPLYP